MGQIALCLTWQHNIKIEYYIAFYLVSLLTPVSHLPERGLSAPSDGLEGVRLQSIVQGEFLEVLAPLNVELERVLKLGRLKFW